MKRRQFLAGTAAVGMGSGIGISTTHANHLYANADDQGLEQPSAEDALKKLIDGNKRYAGGKRLEFQLNKGRLAELEKGQHPFATILGCSDSRVPVELLFDQDPGSLFVIRLAGNVVDQSVHGSLEYAAVHLKTPLIVVMGHEKCGAVTAALASQQDQAKELPGVQKLIQKVKPAINKIDKRLSLEKQIELGVELNVRWSVKQISQHPDHREAVKNGDIKVVGAVYELASGRVRLVEPTGK